MCLYPPCFGAYAQRELASARQPKANAKVILICFVETNSPWVAARYSTNFYRRRLAGMLTAFFGAVFPDGAPVPQSANPVIRFGVFIERIAVMEMMAFYEKIENSPVLEGVGLDNE